MARRSALHHLENNLCLLDDVVVLADRLHQFGFGEDAQIELALIRFLQGDLRFNDLEIDPRDKGERRIGVAGRDPLLAVLSR